MKGSKDPSQFIVFGEDAAAFTGLLVAFLGVFLGQVLHNPYPDRIASITIGIMLALVAIFLMYESKSLLIGETADAEVIKHVRKVAGSWKRKFIKKGWKWDKFLLKSTD